MNFKVVFGMLFCGAVSFLANPVFADNSHGNLYVTFHTHTQDQKLYIDVLESNHKVNKVQCSIKKTSTIAKNNAPTCGFGFGNSPVTISQIRYALSGQPIMQICPELNGKTFSHGSLMVFSEAGAGEKPRCNFGGK